MQYRVSLSILPPFNPLILSKNHFSLLHFPEKSELIILIWGEPHNLCSLLHLCNKWLMMSPLDLLVCRSTMPCPVTMKKYSRIGGLATNINATNPPTNTKNSRKSSNPLTMPVQTTSPVKISTIGIYFSNLFFNFKNWTLLIKFFFIII